MPPYDANGRLIEPIEPDRNHRLGQQRQEDEDTETAGNPASKYKERPIPSIPLQPSVEAEERGADAYQEKNYRLQKRATSIQFWLCVFTASAFCAAAYYAHVADLQLTASRDSARAAVNSTEAAITQVQVGMMNFMASQRAYLSAGDPRQPLLGRQGPIIIPITNYGHFWVAEPLFAITYVRDSAAARSSSSLRRRLGT